MQTTNACNAGLLNTLPDEIIFSSPVPKELLPQQLPPIIGLCGYAGVGKDTVANILLEHASGFYTEHRAFADALRTLVDRLNPWIVNECSVLEPYTSVLDRFGGYNCAKRVVPSIRDTLVHVGSACRGTFGKDIWVDTLLSHSAAPLDNDAANARGRGGLVVSDVRQANEALAIRMRGGVVIMIERPNIVAANDTEHLCIDECVRLGLINHAVRNDGTIEDLTRCISLSLESLAKK